MKLRGKDFGRVCGASGVQGFFGEGYRLHKVPFIGPDFTGMRFTSKTTTLLANQGNMPLRSDSTPEEIFPKCVVVKFWSGVVLNAVSLSGPGAEALLDRGEWQERTQPFRISFMSLEKTPAARIDELRRFVKLVKLYMHQFRTTFALQINFMCPNVGVERKKDDDLVDESLAALNVAAELGLPLEPKYNVLFSVAAAKRVSEHPACDSICVSNTIPYGAHSEFIDWEGLFGKGKSPLLKRGFAQPGGLSGRPLLPFLVDWLREAHLSAFQKPINAGGGILSVSDAQTVAVAGAQSLSLGCVAILRPRRVQRIIRVVNHDGFVMWEDPKPSRRTPRFPASV